MFAALLLPLQGLESLCHILPLKAATLIQIPQLLLLHGLNYSLCVPG